MPQDQDEYEYWIGLHRIWKYFWGTGNGETPKAPWDWKVLEPSLDVACPFPLLGSWPSPLFYIVPHAGWISLSPDMKSCRALTLHFSRYLERRTSGINLCRAAYLNFSCIHATLSLAFQINQASKPGCAAKLLRCPKMYLTYYIIHFLHHTSYISYYFLHTQLSHWPFRLTRP